MKVNKNLSEKYPFIVKWGQMMGSFPYYINNQLELAEETRAPENATFYDEGNNVWNTTDGITNESTKIQLGIDTVVSN